MKRMMLLSLLLMGISFAQPPPITSGPEWMIFKQTVCQGGVATMQTMIALDAYEVGESCSTPEMPYSPQDLCLQICDRGGMMGAYMWMCGECYDYGTYSSQCYSAKREFYSFASISRGMFSTAGSAYLSVARQAIYAYNAYDCSTSPGSVAQTIAGANMGYRECLSEDFEELFSDLNEFCGMFCGDT